MRGVITEAGFAVGRNMRCRWAAQAVPGEIARPLDLLPFFGDEIAQLRVVSLSALKEG
jgi:hypothetical protein